MRVQTCWWHLHSSGFRKRGTGATRHPPAHQVLQRPALVVEPLLGGKKRNFRLTKHTPPPPPPPEGVLNAGNARRQSGLLLGSFLAFPRFGGVQRDLVIPGALYAPWLGAATLFGLPACLGWGARSGMLSWGVAGAAECMQSACNQALRPQETGIRRGLVIIRSSRG